MTQIRIQVTAFVGIMTAIIMFLFLASSTDLILKEEKIKVYNISVIIPDTDSSSWEVFRKGLDAGASKWNVDISFITLYEKSNTAQEQQRLIKRETINGASAIIIVPADPIDMAQYISTLSRTMPIINACIPLPNQNNPQILYDWSQIGEKFASIPSVKNANGARVVYSANDTQIARAKYVVDTFSPFLNKELVKSALEESDDYTGWVKALPEKTALAVLEPPLLIKLADAKKASKRDDIVLVGIGNTSASLSALENGKVDALLCTDDMQAGYLCVKSAISAVEKAKTERILLTARVITAVNMFSEENADMLYPVA